MSSSSASTSDAAAAGPRAGRLTLVGTPIGNLGDLAPRAVEVLAGADLICCEDTRRTGKLLQHAGLGGIEMRVTNEHTEADVVDEVLSRLGLGQQVVVVSDAGMPGISDPGERLVAAAVAAGCDVSVVPGPSAGIAALVTSGLPTGRFAFEGFLPRKGSVRAERVAAVAVEPCTVVLYESPHRLARTVADLREACGDERRVVLSRELTKLYEEHWRGTLAEAVAHVEEVAPRGEYVVVLEGAPAPGEVADAEILDALAAARASGATTRDAVAAVAAALGVPKRRTFDLATR